MNTLANRSDLHISRKLWHVATGSVGILLFFMANIETKTLAKLGLSFALFAFIVEILRLNNSKLNTFFLKYARVLLRKNEQNSISGLPYYALGVGLSLLLFQTHMAVLSVFFLVFADPMSSLVGIKFGKNKFLPNKSVEGSLAFGLICTFITFLYLKSYGVNEYNFFLFSIGAGIVGSLSEIASAFKVNDNLTIPILSGFGLMILNSILPVFL